jgi:hypothetical protein
MAYENDMIRTVRMPSGFSCLVYSAATAAGLILLVSGLVVWPICYIESWRGDPLITGMLVTGFLLVAAGAHFLDCEDEQKVHSRRTSL